MKKKFLKFAIFFAMPIVTFLTLAIFLVSGFSSGFVFAVGGNGGGIFVSSSATTTIENGTTITGSSATNGGGVYVASGGTLNMTGGMVSGNTATGKGNNIYNDGTFTMTGGTVGISGNSQEGFGIYNTGTMNLFGGTIHDNIYSETSFTTKMGANIQGTITLSNSAILTVSDYAGTTPALKIVISEEREDGTILKLKGSSVSPDVSKLIIMGKDLCDCKIEVVQTSSTEWNINIKEVLYIRVDENENEDANGDYVLFGQYPKTLKSDDVEIITSVADSKGYFYGSDGNQYVKVESANPYDPSYTFVDGTTIVSGETYYFKVERIKWRILQESNGQALLLCEDIIDTHQFYGSKENRAVNWEIVYPNNYKYSDVRAWLNGYGQENENVNGENHLNSGFLQKAFSKKTQRIIKITEVDNSASTTDSSSNTYASDEKTNDKVFSLSFQDVIKTSYGFNSDHGVYDSKRKIKTTDYSMVNYIYADKLDEEYYGRWLLRSPASADYRNNLYVSTHGAITHNEWCVEEIIGIAPALTICFNTKTCSHSSLTLTQNEYLQIYENGESVGHYLKKTYECKSCGYSYSEIGDVVDHSCSSTSVVVSDGDSGHHTETTMICSKCPYIKIIKSETESHSDFSVEKTEWVYADYSGHYLETTEKCSSCSWTRKIYDDTILIEHNFSPWAIDGEITSVDDTTHYWINHRYCYDCYYVENLSEYGEHTYEITDTSVVSNGSSGHCTKTDKKCSGCGHEMTEYSSDVSHILVVKNQTLLKNSSGHYTKIESECEQCHYSYVSYTTTEKHTFKTVKTDTISDGSSGHHTETNQKCSVCSYETTEIGETTEHSLSTSYSYLSIDDTYHNGITTKSCSECDYSTSSFKKMTHSLNTDGTCSCGYSKNLMFTSGCDNCSLEIIDQDEFYDDKKKKIGENLLFEDKRNKGDFIFQLPRVGT